MTTLPQTAPTRTPRSLPHNPVALPGPAAMGVSQGAAVQGAMTASDAWRVIRANLWVVIGVIIVSSVFGYALNTWLAAKHPRYTSTGLINVRLEAEKYLPLDP